MDSAGIATHRAGPPPGEARLRLVRRMTCRGSGGTLRKCAVLTFSLLAIPNGLHPAGRLPELARAGTTAVGPSAGQRRSSPQAGHVIAITCGTQRYPHISDMRLIFDTFAFEPHNIHSARRGWPVG